MDINSLILFKKIADFGSLTKTAHDQHMLKSAVSQKLSKLEEDLGVRLFHRNTRSIALTEIGEMIYRHASAITEQRDLIRDAIASTNDEPSGLIRMTAPPDIGAHLTRTVLKRLTSDHPGLRIELDLSTRYVDLINEGFDLAVRATDRGLQDSNLVAVRLCQTIVGLFASASYLKAAAFLRVPADLKAHPIVAFTPQLGMRNWKLKLKSREHSFSCEISPTLAASNFQGALEAIRAGIGIGILPEEICKFELQSGEVVRVLPEWSAGEAFFYAVYPSKKYLSARTKLVLHYLSAAW